MYLSSDQVLRLWTLRATSGGGADGRSARLGIPFTQQGLLLVCQAAGGNTYADQLNLAVETSNMPHPGAW